MNSSIIAKNIKSGTLYRSSILKFSEINMKKYSLVENKLLHYTEKACGDFKMLEKGDRVMVCLSGGKDSFTLLCMLRHIQLKMQNKIDILAFTLDQGQPGWDDNLIS